MIFVLKRISRTEACVRRALQEDVLYPHIELQASLKEWSDSWTQQESREAALTNLMQSIDLVRQLCYACLTIEAIHYVENASQAVQYGEHHSMTEKYAEWPELERYSDIPVFNMKAMVQQSGVAAPTLRAWERRYAILSPERAQNAYRLYSERDIAIIRWLKERVDAGMSISQAVSLFRHFEEEQNKRHQSLAHMGEHEEGEQLKKGDAPTLAQDMQKFDAWKRTNSAPATYNMHVVQERLLAAFSGFDEAMANRLLASALAIYPIEQVCAELITPTLWEIGRLWEQGQITVSIEHFASAFFHGLLTNLFHAMPSGETGPLIIFCCAPGEEHELASLMLSLLLRRVGLHVAYLGQNIESNGLLQTVRQLSPALVCISATLLSRLEAVAELGQRIQELPPPRPAFIFGGQAFAQHLDLIARVPGVYLDGDLQSVIAQLKRMAFQQFEDKN